MFFSSWDDITRTLISGILTYVALVILLRVSGKRTLSKMNAFDLIVTVALGSTLATIILSKDVTLAQGITALLVLVGMQYLITYLSVRSTTVSHIVKAEPTLLLYQGKLLTEAMSRERVIKVEIFSALRNAGIAAIEQVDAVVLETDGSLSVIEKGNQISPKTAYADIDYLNIPIEDNEK